MPEPTGQGSVTVKKKCDLTESLQNRVKHNIISVAKTQTEKNPTVSTMFYIFKDRLSSATSMHMFKQ